MSMRKYTLAELEALPTLSVGQADDLKIDNGDVRVWLSRCTVADGEPYDHKVSVEEWHGTKGKWETVDTYKALESDE